MINFRFWLILITIAYVNTNIDHAAETSAPAVEVASLWESFSAALRRGDYRTAYDCFTQESKELYSYKQFCYDHHPLMQMGQAILSYPQNTQLNVTRDIAELRFTTEGSDPILVSILMVRDNNRWLLEAAPRQTAARIEAEARSILRLLWRDMRVQSAAEQYKPLDDNAIKLILLEYLDEDLLEFLSRNYTFIYTPSKGEVLAMPTHQSLRGFAYSGQASPQVLNARAASQPMIQMSKNTQAATIPTIPLIPNSTDQNLPAHTSQYKDIQQTTGSKIEPLDAAKPTVQEDDEFNIHDSNIFGSSVEYSAMQPSNAKEVHSTSVSIPQLDDYNTNKKDFFESQFNDITTSTPPATNKQAQPNQRLPMNKQPSSSNSLYYVPGIPELMP